MNSPSIDILFSISKEEIIIILVDIGLENFYHYNDNRLGIRMIYRRSYVVGFNEINQSLGYFYYTEGVDDGKITLERFLFQA